jgi:hypothetical protein
MRSFDDHANDGFAAIDDGIFDTDVYIGESGSDVAQENLEAGWATQVGASFA